MHVDTEFDAEMLFLALLSLIMLPAMLPQIVFLASGLESESPEFRQRWSTFFEHLSEHLQGNPA